MKKFLLGLGIIALLLIIFVVGHVSYMAVRGPQLDASSKAYVDQNVPVIVNAWSKDELLKRASEELREALTDQQWDFLFSKISQLGKLKKYEGSQGQSYISLTLKNGKVVTAYYTASAAFQNGPAEIKVRLVQKNGQWLILNFEVDSPLFTK